MFTRSPRLATLVLLGLAALAPAQSATASKYKKTKASSPKELAINTRRSSTGRSADKTAPKLRLQSKPSEKLAPGGILRTRQVILTVPHTEITRQMVPKVLENLPMHSLLSKGQINVEGFRSHTLGLIHGKSTFSRIARENLEKSQDLRLESYRRLQRLESRMKDLRYAYRSGTLPTEKWQAMQASLQNVQAAYSSVVQGARKVRSAHDYLQERNNNLGSNPRMDNLTSALLKHFEKTDRFVDASAVPKFGRLENPAPFIQAYLNRVIVQVAHLEIAAKSSGKELYGQKKSGESFDRLARKLGRELALTGY